MSSTTNHELTTKYQLKTDKQHILDNPDTYIGSVEHVESNVFLYDNEKDALVEKNIHYVPALFKLFDEGIVNCRDHCIRMEKAVSEKVPNSLPVTHIDIQVDEDGTITMENDGNGIDVAQHPEYKVWIPELIFGHLRTSTNYNKEEKKIVGGKNGFGFKLVLIWSTYGCIETVDHVRGLKYTQSFHTNLDIIDPPKVTKCTSKKPYTRIVFKPDYARLGIPGGLTADMIALFKKRTYDIAAVTDKSIKVKWNGTVLPVKQFAQYVDLYVGHHTSVTEGEAETTGIKKIHELANDRWEYAVALSPTHEFVQVSFVNGIYTSKGGKHVEYILGQITRKMCAYIEKKRKVEVNANAIKEQLMLFLRCDIENPSFDSQTKDYMNTPSTKFGSKCEVSDKFIEKLVKLGVMDAACALTELKENKAAKKTDGAKTRTIRGIPKLIDANWAGTDKSQLCTIIFCEGDSAKAGIVSGLSSEDRNTIGVYPMKGKIFNVRGELSKRISENKEITEIKKILGLETGKTYKNTESLRYGHILFMTDQDLDGSHIKGLGINLFQHEWASLAHIPGFIGFMNTPILKARKGSEEKVFYNEGEYAAWKTALGDNAAAAKSWKVKYYKGLGTSTGKEFREYFENKKVVNFCYNEDEKTSDDAIDMVFNKKRADDRKAWLGAYERDRFLNTGDANVRYEDFINKELIHFSKYDCDRSIPNLMDGLKISLRKILYSAFKKGLTQEIKVAQFSGYVSEHSGYHHGEASLNAAIVAMAQTFVGSNNMNLFMPNGQFGSRLQGGKDSASERYIFTQLTKWTRFLFKQEDDDILTYLNDDGFPVEPIYYAPIIPMILVNGSKGIGTGFSTEVLSYNPLHLIEYLKMKLMANTAADIEALHAFEFMPYYEGFTGSIQKIAEQKYLVKGKYTKLGGDKIRITELPVGTWTDDYKEYLESLTEASVDKTGKKTAAPVIKEYDDMSKDTTVDFVITLAKGKLDELEMQTTEYGNGVEKQFKLTSTLSTTNMHLFNAEDKLRKYDTVQSIVDDYYLTRIEMYQTRKDHLIRRLESELNVLSNKVRYIKENLEGSIDLRKKKKEEVIAILVSKKYDIQEGDAEYKYLVKMPMDSVTEENVLGLNKEHAKKSDELALTKARTIKDMWFYELEQLEEVYKEERERMWRVDHGGGSAAATLDKKKKVVKKTK